MLQIGVTTLELRDDGTTLSTPKLLADAAESTFTGTVLVKKLFTCLKGLVGKGSGGAWTYPVLTDRNYPITSPR